MALRGIIRPEAANQPTNPNLRLTPYLPTQTM